MKIEDLDNYVLRVTEKYMRYYYSAEAQILKNETIDYEITEDLEIRTSVDQIQVTGFILDGDDILGIRIKYINTNSDYETVEVKFGDPAVDIKLEIGTPDVSRVSKCTLELVKK